MDKEYRSFVDEFFDIMSGKIDAYIHKKNKELPPEAGYAFLRHYTRAVFRVILFMCSWGAVSVGKSP